MITRRTTFPLLLLFLTLLAIFLWQQQAGGTPDEETPIVPTLETAVPLFPEQTLFSLREVAVQRLADRAAVQLTHDGQGAFMLVAPISASADDALLLNQLGALTSIGSRRTLNGKLADFGLDAPTHQIVVRFENETITVAVGNLAPNPTQIYVLRDDLILLLPTAVIQPLLDWIDEPPTGD